MPVINHTHKLKLVENRLGNKVFFCATGKCTFRIPQKMSLGKLCICWRCGKEFELTPYSYALVKPHCPECTKSKKGIVNAGLESKKVIISLSDRLHRSISESDKESDTHSLVATAADIEDDIL